MLASAGMDPPGVRADVRYPGHQLPPLLKAEASRIAPLEPQVNIDHHAIGPGVVYRIWQATGLQLVSSLLQELSLGRDHWFHFFLKNRQNLPAQYIRSDPPFQAKTKISLEEGGVLFQRRCVSQGSLVIGPWSVGQRSMKGRIRNRRRKPGSLRGVSPGVERKVGEELGEMAR